ncbi:MAG: PIN domain-containing protein, partial [Thermoproteus sp.]|nr:PIN domain-containing protein [Thermoproteus sp.]
GGQGEARHRRGRRRGGPRRGSTKEAVVDTNVFTNAVVEDYPYHEGAGALLDSLNRWLMPIIVVYELAWLAERLGMGRGVVKAVLEHGKTRVVCDRGEISSAAL